MSEIRTDTINNASGDNDSGIDLSTNDQVSIKTANTTAVTVDSSQRVGIGTTTPASNCEIESSGDTTLRITAGGTSNDSKIDFVHGTTVDGGITYDHNGSYASERLAFRAGNNGTHMYLTGDGDLGMGTSGPVAKIHVNVPNLGNLDGIRIVNSTNNTGGYFIRFQNSSGSVAGAVEQNGTATVSYNTSSDYRLKENIVTMSGAIDRVKQLLPKRFNFIADGTDRVVDGFLAHEAQTVVPEAISGTHNGLEVWKEGEELPDGVSVGDNKLDDEGNTIPKYQGIDQSKLVPLLTGALKEAIAKIEALETRIEALENA